MPHMPAIDLVQPASARLYAWSGITVTPAPPALGEVTTIAFALGNSGRSR
jgi:hypothetical protein